MDALSCKWVRCNISIVLANRAKLETRPSTRPVRPCLHPACTQKLSKIHACICAHLPPHSSIPTRQVLAASIQVNLSDENGLTPLHWAVLCWSARTQP